ncbi:MAG: hypothetical protein EAZ95_17470 [Bacteroidetes bacterium]|nr:MAG: hypothetical protein EAZ95_17470 [Bacteroidota bacterium]
MNNQVTITYLEKHLPTLNDRGKDPSKKWVITYYLYNINTGKYERNRKTICPTSKNRGNYDKRLREARTFVADIKSKMKEGLHIEKKEVLPLPPALPQDKSLKDNLQSYIESKSLQPKMKKAINAVFRIMEKNCASLLDKPLSQVDKQDFFSFRETIKTKVSATTCNYYARVLSCFFNYCIENDWITKNPAKGVKPLRTIESSANYPFTPTQRQAILDKMLELGETQLYLLCQFVYYTLARPYEEIQNLKIGNIREKDIFYPASNAKNGKSYAVPIAPSLEAIIQEYKLREYPAEYYLLGEEGKPSPKPYPPTKIFYLKHRKILKELELTELNDRRYTFYSHKPSGAIALAEKAKNLQDLRKIQMMCRHKTLEETEGYLRKMGVNLSSDDTNS